MRSNLWILSVACCRRLRSVLSLFNSESSLYYLRVIAENTYLPACDVELWLTLKGPHEDGYKVPILLISKSYFKTAPARPLIRTSSPEDFSIFYLWRHPEMILNPCRLLYRLHISCRISFSKIKDKDQTYLYHGLLTRCRHFIFIIRLKASLQRKYRTNESR